MKLSLKTSLAEKLPRSREKERGNAKQVWVEESEGSLFLLWVDPNMLN